MNKSSPNHVRKERKELQVEELYVGESLLNMNEGGSCRQVDGEGLCCSWQRVCMTL